MQVVGEDKSVSWGGAKTKGEVHECEITKNMLSQSDFLQLCLKKKRKITEFFPDTTVFYYTKSRCKLIRKKDRVILTNHIIL